MGRKKALASRTHSASTLYRGQSCLGKQQIKQEPKSIDEQLKDPCLLISGALHVKVMCD